MSSLGYLVPGIEFCPYLEKGVAVVSMFANVQKFIISPI